MRESRCRSPISVTEEDGQRRELAIFLHQIPAFPVNAKTPSNHVTALWVCAILDDGRR
jgi:hypothetical protein